MFCLPVKQVQPFYAKIILFGSFGAFTCRTLYCQDFILQWRDLTRFFWMLTWKNIEITTSLPLLLSALLRLNTPWQSENLIELVFFSIRFDYPDFLYSFEICHFQELFLPILCFSAISCVLLALKYDRWNIQTFLIWARKVYIKAR